MPEEHKRKLKELDVEMTRIRSEIEHAVATKPRAHTRLTELRDELVTLSQRFSELLDSKP
jgi:uncharacterized protein YPO0396